MAKTVLEDEVNSAIQCIKDGHNFVLEGGAGSGKTYSLISLINAIISDNPNIRIVCITYTNNAVTEIKSRIESENLCVSTIHEFMWNLIKKYQNEIKDTLVELINDKAITAFKKPKDYGEENISRSYFEDLHVTYDEYYSMTPNGEGKIRISHDHVLMLAENMFNKYIKLSDILKDVADCIFVDEYQDTSKLVVSILLNHLQRSNKKNVVGFFGDSMQSIYDDGVGDLKGYELRRIVKTKNRRNPKAVIEIANLFRDDEMEQVPSDDINAPNMENGVVKKGSVKFLYGRELESFDQIRAKSIFKTWDYHNGKNTKELRLTHKYNAEMAGFKDLYELYNDDLIVKLISKMEAKIAEEGLSTDRTLGELALELKLKFRKEDLLEQIIKNDTYKIIYTKLKNVPMKDINEKCRVTKESLMSYKLNGLSGKYEANSYRDRILRRLDILEETLGFYENNKYNDLLRITKFVINSREDKVRLKQAVEYLAEEKHKTIGEVLKYAEDQGLLKEDELYSDFILNKGYYLWERIKDIPFSQYRKSIFYLREYSPICTQHSVKGSEYDNVLLVLDSNGWNKYDFNTLFGRGSKSNEVRSRTKKLFYVCITRVKSNLLIYMPTEDTEIVAEAKNIFGGDNVVRVSDIK